MMLTSWSLIFFITKTERNTIDLNWLKAIRMQNLPPISYNKIFNKEQYRRMPITNMDDFYKVANSEFNRYQSELSTTWSIQSPQLLKTLFFMNLVSNMWGYGNKIAINKSGCVENNEDTLFQTIIVEPLIIKHYLKTKIGCCIDSARFLSFLLERAQIKNRLVLNPGHIFNEAFIDGKWMAFDATVNFWWHTSWEKIQNEPLGTPIDVTIFPHKNLITNDDFYREKIGAFQLSLLLQAAYKYSKDIKYPKRV
ncbi:MAG: hypothetical protein CK426_08065 [Legionella sp.]|nr:MAG: hypothetical protein CK426_08065 [Legionella sp.]